MDANQFYPTPSALAARAVKKFKQHSISRLLEPSAGRADLLDAFLNSHYGYRTFSADCVEIDFDNQAVLRAKGHRIVGHDFLQYRGACSYSHILMNPPFNRGVDHVLHAWSLLQHGELVAIINAASVENATTKTQLHLKQLIAEHGDVEFVDSAFTTEDTKRTTNVRVAIVYLKKESGEAFDFTGDLAKEDHADKFDQDTIAAPNELILPKTAIQNVVTAFNCAVTAAKQAATAKVKAGYYADMLGKSIVDSGDDSSVVELPGRIAHELNKQYDELKERAWSNILKSSDVTKRMSSNSQKKLMAAFEDIKCLEFTVANIYGFLDGLIGQQGEMQLEMLCDTFDEISKYHPQNSAYYQGWKSNAKHRVNAWRIMMTRFILPSKDNDGWINSRLCWDDRGRFDDFDKAFAMLDGKNHESVYGLVKLFDGFTDNENPENSIKSKYAELARGERVACDYFEVRYYPTAGTFHIFPTRKDLIDRLNRMVGKHRQWLPEEHETTPDSFWQQFDQAEKINRKIKMDGIRAYDLHTRESNYKDRAHENLLAQHEQALAACKIEFDGVHVLDKPNTKALAGE